MEKEICMVCPNLMCVDEGKGRRIFFADSKSQETINPIQDCTKFLAVAVLGLNYGNTIIYKEQDTNERKIYSQDRS
jgi:hypothetical protein